MCRGVPSPSPIPASSGVSSARRSSTSRRWRSWASAPSRRGLSWWMTPSPSGRWCSWTCRSTTGSSTEPSPTSSWRTSRRRFRKGSLPRSSDAALHPRVSGPDGLRRCYGPPGDLRSPPQGRRGGAPAPPRASTGDHARPERQPRGHPVRRRGASGQGCVHRTGRSGWAGHVPRTGPARRVPDPQSEPGPARRGALPQGSRGGPDPHPRPIRRRRLANRGPHGSGGGGARSRERSTRPAGGLLMSDCAAPVPSGPKPPWLRIRLDTGSNYRMVRGMIEGLKLHTVCQEARCPNIYECWGDRTATFMILGDVCTRRCGFCAVATGRPRAVDPEEPERLAEAVKHLALEHAVITMVDRDDLPDGGAAHVGAVIRAVRRRNPGCEGEILTSDFRDVRRPLEVILPEGPVTFSHNVETVPRLYPTVRQGSTFGRSLGLPRDALLWRRSAQRPLVKTGLMVGLGETRDELLETFSRLAGAGVEILTLGQYLRPSLAHLPVARYYHPDEFRALREEALRLGFRHVEAGPLVAAP